MRHISTLILLFFNLIGFGQAPEPDVALLALLRGEKTECFEILDDLLDNTMSGTLPYIRALEMKGECYFRLNDIGEAKRLWDVAAIERLDIYSADHPKQAVSEAFSARYHNYMAGAQNASIISAKSAARIAREVALTDPGDNMNSFERVMALREFGYATKLTHPDTHPDHPSGPDAGRVGFHEALAIAEQLNDTLWMAQVMHDIGNTFTDQIRPSRSNGDLAITKQIVDSAEWYYRRSLEYLHAFGLEWSTPAMMEHFTLGLLNDYTYDSDGLRGTIKGFNAAMHILQGMAGEKVGTATFQFNERIADKAQMVELCYLAANAYHLAVVNGRSGSFLDSAIVFIEASFPYFDAMLREYTSEEFYQVTGIFSHFPFQLGAELYAMRYKRSGLSTDLDKAFLSAERNRNIREQRDRFLLGFSPVDLHLNGAFHTLKAPPGHLIIAYHNHRNTYAYVISEQGSEMVDLGLVQHIHYQSRSGFDEYINTFLQGDLDVFVSYSNMLYNGLLEPILADHNVQHITIIPFDGMWHLPFGTLCMDSAATSFSELNYVVEEYSIRYARNVNEALQLPQFFTNDSLHIAAATDDTRSALPFNLQLNEKLSAIWPNSFQSELTRKQIPQLVNSGGLAHFLAHAEIPSGADAEPYLILHDGKFTHSDMIDLDCKKELVVLAACSSGKGKVYKTQGSLNLGSGLLRAGAGSVVQTLWPVDDKATAELLGIMYAYIENGNSVANALAQAKRDFIQEHANDAYSSPYYWGGIILTGGDHQLEKRRSIIIPALTGAALLLLIYFSFFRRRTARERN